MKKIIQTAVLALMVSTVAVSCKKKPKDTELVAQATEIVKTNPKASVEVKDGVAHLSGVFATQEEKDAMIASLKAIPGVKDVMDMATVTPAVVTTSVIDPMVQQKLADAVKDFPKVKAEVVDGELTLTGEVTAEQAKKIKMSVDALKLGKVNFKYNVKK